MEIKAATVRTDEFIQELLQVWEASVRATHHFLTEADINFLTPYVRQGAAGICDLVYTVDDKGSLSGFMGVENGKIEMLFIHPAHRGTGLGKKFIHYALDVFEAALVDVNEQNTQGLGFYTHMGFKVLSRSPLDECGKPFPILHMGRESVAH